MSSEQVGLTPIKIGLNIEGQSIGIFHEYYIILDILNDREMAAWKLSKMLEENFFIEVYNQSTNSFVHLRSSKVHSFYFMEEVSNEK